MTGPEGRHVSPETLSGYVTSGFAASIPVAGEPEAVLTINPREETLRLEVSWDGEQPPTIEDYVHISTDVRFRRGRNWATVAVHGTRFFSEAYPLLRSVADLVQLEGATFAAAVERSLGSYHDLLSASGQMPVREEVGLYGELLVVSHLITTLGAAPALSAWRGGNETEEHDLGLAHDDVEVKTTTAEGRRHWIGTLGQLRPTPGRRLWLLSVQLTGAGASEAERLPDVVARVEAQLPIDLQTVLHARLASTRYRPRQPRDTFRLLRLRSKPACFLVQGDFPRIDGGILTAGGAAVGDIEEVSYLIRLDGRTPDANPPAPLHGLGTRDTPW